eukprot:TRINITY_DN67764_c7_g1_i1.p2 TRINITY_DN67764_c7_g1~~TRINITY_DN67764_c7_g1_i1.p2  ORF type:complete len:139 (+),score=21.29 TRINITY_DN67764_c7_g1_i1:880-1296(+)
MLDSDATLHRIEMMNTSCATPSQLCGFTMAVCTTSSGCCCQLLMPGWQLGHPCRSMGKKAKSAPAKKTATSQATEEEQPTTYTGDDYQGDDWDVDYQKKLAPLQDSRGKSPMSTGAIVPIDSYSPGRMLTADELDELC